MSKKRLLLSTDYHFYQYFTQVVPTEVRTYINNVDTYQFAVTEQVITDSLPWCWLCNSQFWSTLKVLLCKSNCLS